MSWKAMPIKAVAAAGGNLSLRPAGEDRPDLRGGAEQRGRLGANHGEIIVLARLRILGGGQLHDLAFGDHYGSRGKHFERLQRADFDHHLERLAKQEIANEHGGLVAP